VLNQLWTYGTDHFKGIYRIYPNVIKENRRMSTGNRLDLQALGSQPILPKNLPHHWCTDGCQQYNLSHYEDESVSTVRIIQQEEDWIYCQCVLLTQLWKLQFLGLWPNNVWGTLDTKTKWRDDLPKFCGHATWTQTKPIAHSHLLVHTTGEQWAGLEPMRATGCN
jgi:hypothetical protein